MRLIISLILLGIAVAPARAHDPYEITSVVYLQSNRMELFLEMEFPTGMTLAGSKPTRVLSAREQFETAVPQLRDLAGNFYNFTAGNHVVPALATNVELGVEDHIQFRVEYATTPHRPLRFAARRLAGSAVEDGYGVSLTVLDMVNQKVLGQTTLFGASAPAEFPQREEAAERGSALVEAEFPTGILGEASAPEETPELPANHAAQRPGRSHLSVLILPAGLGFLIMYFIFRRRT